MALNDAQLKSNRYIHDILQSLEHFSVDLATDKLWTALLFLQRGDYGMCLRTSKALLSSIPPYALYFSQGNCTSSYHTKGIYEDAFFGSEMNVVQRARTAWLIDFMVSKDSISTMPPAIQVELAYCDPLFGVLLSPFACAYYFMFLCYHTLGEYENRNRTLRLLVDVANNNEQCGYFVYHTYNIVGHCLMFVGEISQAMEMFVKSCQFTLKFPLVQEYNAGYDYLRNLLQG